MYGVPGRVADSEPVSVRRVLDSLPVQPCPHRVHGGRSGDAELEVAQPGGAGRRLLRAEPLPDVEGEPMREGAPCAEVGHADVGHEHVILEADHVAVEAAGGIQIADVQVDVPHPIAGTIPLVANPIKFSRTPLTYEAPPPMLGEHTEAVLREVLGKSPQEIRALRERGVV